MTRSALDDVVGLGPGRRTRLLKEFGSVRKIRTLSEEELLSVTWLPESVGRRLYEHLHGPAQSARPTPSPVLSSWRGDE
jgi:excinuclease ABC subunit C